MSNKNYFLLSAIVFTIAGVLHAVRVLMGWELSLNGFGIPSWLSMVAAVVTIALAFVAYKKAQ